jgi:type III secretory pathway component EscV
MKYLFSLETTSQMDNMEEAKKELVKLIEQTKPEAMYFSTIRRLITIVADVEDPHIELRLIFETLSKYGKVTIDPVSTFEEFGPFMAQL